jgi:hypothetical protein
MRWELPETNISPGAIYLVGQWYPPDRTQFRMALFYCASAASGAFSGLLAAAIAKMNGMLSTQPLSQHVTYSTQALATMRGTSPFQTLIFECKYPTE